MPHQPRHAGVGLHCKRCLRFKFLVLSATSIYDASAGRFSELSCFLLSSFNDICRPFEAAAFRRILSVLQARSVFGSSSSTSSFCYLQPPAALHQPPPPLPQSAAAGVGAFAGHAEWEYLLQLVCYLGLQDLLPQDAGARDSSSNGSTQQHSSSNNVGGSSNSSGGSKAHKHGQPTPQRLPFHQSINGRVHEKSSNAAAATAEPMQGSINNAPTVPAAAAAAAALHALPVRHMSSHPSTDSPRAAWAERGASRLSNDGSSAAAAASRASGALEALLPQPAAAAAAHAAAVQALLPKRLD